MDCVTFHKEIWKERRGIGSKKASLLDKDVTKSISQGLQACLLCRNNGGYKENGRFVRSCLYFDFLDYSR